MRLRMESCRTFHPVVVDDHLGSLHFGANLVVESRFATVETGGFFAIYIIFSRIKIYIPIMLHFC
jgi:hypothetical protein